MVMEVYVMFEFRFLIQSKNISLIGYLREGKHRVLDENGRPAASPYAELSSTNIPIRFYSIAL